MAQQVIALQALNQPEKNISLNVGVIEGGRLRNVIPDYALIRFEIRAFSPEELASTARAVATIFERETVPGVTFKLSSEPAFPPMPRTPAVAELEALTMRIAAELGYTVKGASTGGAADAAYAAGE